MIHEINSVTEINGFIVRPVELKDNPEVAALIRSVLTEHGAVGEGYAIADPEVDAMYETYQGENTFYYVVQSPEGRIVGGAGVARLRGTTDAEAICEFQKFYLYPEYRSKGLGKHLTERGIAAARHFGFKRIYLETLPQMKDALRLYQQYGFTHLDGPLGNTGHHKCSIWCVKEL